MTLLNEQIKKGDCLAVPGVMAKDYVNGKSVQEFSGINVDVDQSMANSET